MPFDSLSHSLPLSLSLSAPLSSLSLSLSLSLLPLYVPLPPPLPSLPIWKAMIERSLQSCLNSIAIAFDCLHSSRRSLKIKSGFEDKLSDN